MSFELIQKREKSGWEVGAWLEISYKPQEL